MIVLAIDPGLASVGYSLVRKENDEFEVLEFGCIRTSSKAKTAFRIQTIYEALHALARKYHPETIILEKIFFAKNAKTALLVGESRGAILLLSANLGVPVHEFTPLQVKQAMTGFGRASKNQIKYMVQKVFSLAKPPTPDDAADALAIAFTYFQTNRLEQYLA
jgi:crossover junction endodeoxyribonuclease RuvC